MFIVTKRAGKIRDSVVWFGPVPIQLTDGRSSDISNHVDRDFLVERVGRSASFHIEEAANAPAQPRTPYPQPEGGLVGQDPTPRDLARMQGWSDEDLEGTGEGGEWGAEGGRSPLTGLTAAEMAITKPPEGWDRMAPYAYPWYATPWHPPGQGWVPPTCPTKPKPPPELVLSFLNDDQIRILGEEHGLVVENIDQLRSSLIELLTKLMEEEGAPPEPVAPPTSDEPEEEDEPEDEDDETNDVIHDNGDGLNEPDLPEEPGSAPQEPELEALQNYGTQDEIDTALAVTAELIQAKNGAIPSYNQLRYHLDKAGLPRPGKHERVALLHALGHDVEA